MRILVTGANGFVGRYLVEEALNKKNSVFALVRKEFPKHWDSIPELRVLKADLLSPDSYSSKIKDVDIVIHAAASTSGIQKNHYLNTINSTQCLLNALDANGITRLIGISSISILDYIGLPAMSSVDERVSVNRARCTMGSYALMKREQEDLMLKWGARSEKKIAIVRPGLVYDEKTLSSAHVGFSMGGFGLSVSHEGEVPVVHAESVASAIVSLSHIQFESIVIHLVNDQLPSQSEYLATIQALPTVEVNLSFFLPISWEAYSNISRLIRFLMSSVGMGEKVPDSFKENSVAGRFKPFRFSNSFAKMFLNWTPKKRIFNRKNF